MVQTRAQRKAPVSESTTTATKNRKAPASKTSKTKSSNVEDVEHGDPVKTTESEVKKLVKTSEAKPAKQVKTTKATKATKSVKPVEEDKVTKRPVIRVNTRSAITAKIPHDSTANPARSTRTVKIADNVAADTKVEVPKKSLGKPIKPAAGRKPTSTTKSAASSEPASHSTRSNVSSRATTVTGVRPVSRTAMRPATSAKANASMTKSVKSGKNLTKASVEKVQPVVVNVETNDKSILNEKEKVEAVDVCFGAADDTSSTSSNTDLSVSNKPLLISTTTAIQVEEDEELPTSLSPSPKKKSDVTAEIPLGTPVFEIDPFQSSPIHRQTLKEEEAPKFEPSGFKSSVLSPTKSLGTPMKRPGCPSRSNRVAELPVRNTPSSFQKASSQLLKLSSTPSNSQPMDSMGLFIEENNPLKMSMTKSIGLSPAKFIGTPVRKFPTSSLSLKVPSTAVPTKRSAPISPWNPSSVRVEKKSKLVMTPTKNIISEVKTAAGGSCMKDGSKSVLSKKNVSFQQIQDESPAPQAYMSMLPRLSEGIESEHVPEFVEDESELAPRFLDKTVEPELMEAETSEKLVNEDTEIEPLSLSEVLDIQFSPEKDEGVQSEGNEKKEPILQNVNFFVDVWASDGSNANLYFIPLLEEMGASISSMITDDVTHILFKDGQERTLKTVFQRKGAIKCVNVGWALDCEKYQTHMPEDAYRVISDFTPNTPAKTLSNTKTPGRTPLHPLSYNKSSPTPKVMTSKTPGTIKFDAAMQAIRMNRIETPDFSKIHMDTDSPITTSSSPTPLMLKTCPSNKVGDSMTLDGDKISRKLFKGVRRSIGGALMINY